MEHVWEEVTLEDSDEELPDAKPGVASGSGTDAWRNQFLLARSGARRSEPLELPAAPQAQEEEQNALVEMEMLDLTVDDDPEDEEKENEGTVTPPLPNPRRRRFTLSGRSFAEALRVPEPAEEEDTLQEDTSRSERESSGSSIEFLEIFELPGTRIINRPRVPSPVPIIDPLAQETPPELPSGLNLGPAIMEMEEDSDFYDPDEGLDGVPVVLPRILPLQPVVTPPQSPVRVLSIPFAPPPRDLPSNSNSATELSPSPFADDPLLIPAEAVDQVALRATAKQEARLKSIAKSQKRALELSLNPMRPDFVRGERPKRIKTGPVYFAKKTRAKDKEREKGKGKVKVKRKVVPVAAAVEEEKVVDVPFKFNQEALDKYVAARKAMFALKPSGWPRDRLTCGQSWKGEFDPSLHNAYQRNKARQTRLSGKPYPGLPTDTLVFQAMVDELNYGNATVTIIPSRDPEGPYTPPFEFFYTNRVVYSENLPLPHQSPGCDCDGVCSNAADSTCACRKRQIKASTFIEAIHGDKHEPRSNNRGFSYTEDGLLHPNVRPFNEPIYECNSECGCGPECINRVVGNGATIPVDIYYTGKMTGWGVRSPLDAPPIRAGQPLMLYAGELIEDDEADDRLYSKIGRSYLFDLDHLTIVNGELDPCDPIEEKRYPYTTHEASIDAFSYGNWTRFLNHNCCDANVMIRPVYTDEINHGRPLLVCVAQREILAGQQLFISYFGGGPAELGEGQKLAQYQKEAKQARKNIAADYRCYCGHKLCRGYMFREGDE